MIEGRRIRVVVADDHAATRSGLVLALNTAPDIEVVGQAADGPAVVDETRRLRPDVVLTDVRMPGATGIDVTPQLMECGAKVLVISAFDVDSYVVGSLAAGAEGYVVKTEKPAAIAEAVRAVTRGESVVSRSTMSAVVKALRAHARNAPEAERGAGRDGGSRELVRRREPNLTSRETEVLARVAEGESNREIADRLFISVPTVKTHIANAMDKLQVNSRVQAALWWHRNGPL